MSMFRRGDDSDSDDDEANIIFAKEGSRPRPKPKAPSYSGSDDEGDMFGNLLDIPEGADASSSTAENDNRSIRLREFPLPKHLPSAFTLPKKLLSDTLNSTTRTKASAVAGALAPLPGADREDMKGVSGRMILLKVEYVNVGGMSRAKRMRLNMEWAPEGSSSLAAGKKAGSGGGKREKKGDKGSSAAGSGASTPARLAATDGLADGLAKLGLEKNGHSTGTSTPAPAPTPPQNPDDFTYSILMDTVGCSSQVEAENFLSLIALHEFTTGTPHSLLSKTKMASLGIALPKPPAPAPATEGSSTAAPKGEDFTSLPTPNSSTTNPSATPITPPASAPPTAPALEPLLPLDDLPTHLPFWLPEYPPINPRNLPLPYRDVWDELEGIRKEWEDFQSRRVWRRLEGLMVPEGSREGGEDIAKEKTAGTAPEGSKPAKMKRQRPNGTPRGELQPDQQILDQWFKRASSPAYQRMLHQRSSLPIAAFRKQIVDTLEKNQVLVLSGETGCGKSTQLPSFILEHHLSNGLPCKIFVTEPRRISAISLAERVSRELGDNGVVSAGAGEAGGLVGYSIRLESKIGRNTRLAFVTNGIALRMLEAGASAGGKGTAFDEVTHIIVDEVHERSIDSDFLLIVLKSLMEQRPDLKIVLMSATIESDKISNYFDGCPVLAVPGRTFPVKVGYLEDAVQYTGWTIAENSQYALHGRQNRNQLEWAEEPALDDDDEENENAPPPDPLKLSSATYSLNTVKTVNLVDPKQIPYELILRLLETLCLEQRSPYAQAILVFLPGLNEIRRVHDMLQDHKEFSRHEDFRVYPLHSTISTENQGAVFEIPPPGVRKIVLSTNIAETGVTIPDITCVIDSGKHREMHYDEKRAISKLTETYIARSNAAQRRGRAGRVQEGLAFHLFTKARHDNQLAPHPLPEMLRLSLQDLALRIKILKVKIGSSIADGLSKALDPPLAVNVTRAVNSLIEVKALTPTEDITPMGLLLSRLPVDVHLGKFLLFAALFRCLDPALTIAATLNSKSPFVAPFGHESEADTIKQSFKIENNDFLTIHNVFSIWRRMYNNNPNMARTFCRRNFLSFQSLQQIEELRQQLYSYLIDSQFITVSQADRTAMNAARYHRGYRVHFLEIPKAHNENAEDTQLISATLAAGLYPKILVADMSTGGLKTLTNNQAISIHPSSVNFRTRMRDFDANHIVYFTIMQSKKLYAWETGPVADVALFLLCGEHLDTKIWSTSTIIDRKIKFNAEGDALLALEKLREEFGKAISLRLERKSLADDAAKWFELGVKCLMKPPEPTEDQITRIGVQIAKS